MQTVSIGKNLHEISNSIFKKNKKNISVCRLLKILPSVIAMLKTNAEITYWELTDCCLLFGQTGLRKQCRLGSDTLECGV